MRTSNIISCCPSLYCLCFVFQVLFLLATLVARLLGVFSAMGNFIILRLSRPHPVVLMLAPSGARPVALVVVPCQRPVALMPAPSGAHPVVQGISP